MAAIWMGAAVRLIVLLRIGFFRRYSFFCQYFFSSFFSPFAAPSLR